MAPNTRSNSSRASSIAGPTTDVGHEHRRSEQPTSSSRKQSASTTASKRLYEEPLSGGDRSASTTQRPLQGMGSSEEPTGPTSFQKGNHQRKSVPPGTFQEDRLQITDEQDEQLESSSLGLEHVRNQEEGQTPSIRSAIASKSEQRRAISTTPDHDTRGIDTSIAPRGRDSSEELDLTVLPLDRELINPMFHHLKLYLDPLVTSNDKLLNEIQTIESLVKTCDPSRRIDSVQRAIMDLQLQNSAKVQEEETALTRLHNEEVIKLLSNLTLEKRRQHDNKGHEINKAPEVREHDTPPHMREVIPREVYKRKSPFKQKDQLNQQRADIEEEESWINHRESSEQINKGKNKEPTIKSEEPPDNSLRIIHTDSMSWLVKQRKRLQAAQPGASKDEVIDKVLDQCPGNLDHAVRSRLGEQNDFVSFTKVFEQVVKRTTIGREKPQMRGNQDWKTQATSGSSSANKPAIAKPAVVRVPGKCDTCGSTESGHDFRACRRKSKGVNMIDQEPSDEETPAVEDLEINFHDDEDSMYDDGEYRAVQEESSHTADISNLEEVFEVMDISCLEITDKRRPVFVDRRNIVPKLGSPFLTTMCNSWKMSMLIDTGACNSLITPRILDKIWLHWEKDAKRPKHNRKYFSASGKMEAIGEITLPIHFLHETDPCILMIDFFIIENARHVEVILGADMMNLYGNELYISANSRN
ncbi:uncharacterized protein MELLADRAFT_105145 [Melampsora larici-populina 98AG31]|uniref:Uncharacterized protein n=1 Tax=Melampsora larici-populina (strain 98AG31 / pathotype 3-4-7) TaxID=747676 RepID=F4RGS3_MELLP|nr:uncharacterized protein MELLADRAFT_105145 [Melampsora larici-populina 98AG31]EGG08342.1 hypothetical protein MELLADRAFT_105145 [Melampsora larici-populina 98AG31]